MQIIDTTLKDVKILRPMVFGDARGFFMETFRDRDFRNQIADVAFVQDNHSRSGKGVLRGVIAGEVFDVAVDIRKSSPDFGCWAGAVLSAENKDMLWVPPGFAHGFYVMSDQAEMVYKSTDYYAPEHERVILWNDPAIGIDWPLSGRELPLLSSKDEGGRLLKDVGVFS